MILEVFKRRTPYAFPTPPLVAEPGSFKGTAHELRALVLKQITEHPESFDMNTFISNSERMVAGWTEPEEAQNAIQWDNKPQCGTTLCIAGYAQLFVEGKITQDVDQVAKRLLGLEDDWLFYLSDEGAIEELTDLVDNNQ